MTESRTTPRISRRALIVLTAATIATASLTPHASAPASFDGGKLVDSGNREIGLELGDFNEDGYADVITANANGTVSLQINRTDNWFNMAPGSPMSVGGNNQKVVSGDFNHDNHLDAAVVAINTDAVYVLLGDGTGGLTLNDSYPTGSGPFDVAAADVNGDGHLDLVTANQANTVPTSAPTVSVLLGAGDGTFVAASPRDYIVGAAGALARGVAIGDVTGDTQPDIVVVNSNADAVRILVGAGDGSFTLSPTSYPTTAGPRKVVLGDFDENGSLDIATADSGDGVPPNRNNKTTVLLNDGLGAFTPAAGSPFTTGPFESSPFAVRAADLGGDGHLDLVFVNRHNASLSLLTGAGDGSFAAPVMLPYPEFDPGSPPEATDVAVGDINNDGRPDVIGNAAGSPGFLITFLNTTTIAPPTLSATSPASPSNVASPMMQGTTDGATVTLYTTNGCWGPPVATGTKAEFEGAGITVSAATDTTTTYYATTTNAAGWATSSCSSTSASYTHDAIAPDAPTIASSSPASPSLDSTPELLGGAEAGSTIRIYAASDCSGSPVTTGTAAGFASPGLTATAAALTTTTFSATATDAAGNTSLCSPPFTYVACRLNPVVTAASDHPAIPNELRDAIAEACTGSTITFAVDPKTIVVGGALVLNRDLTIDGANEISIVQGVNAPVFRVQSGVVTLKGLTISEGLGDIAGHGGGINVSGGSLTIRNSWITNNDANGGAGVGITGGSVAIIDSTISGNRTNGIGGGISRQFAFADPGTLTIENTTISGNSATGDGGAIYNDAPGLTIVNSTITNNRADSDSDGSLTAGGIRSLDDVVVLKNTIVAGNKVTGNSPGDLKGHFSGSTNNLIGADVGIGEITNGSDGNQIGTQASPIDPRLGPLANNGGPTQTHALLTGSPALDAGSNANTLPSGSTTDQRGYRRVLDGPDADATQTVDLGAVEQNPSIEDLADRTIFEDTATAASPPQVLFNLGDPSGGNLPGDFESVAATSSNQALVTDANLVITGSGSTRTLSIQTESNAFGTATIAVTVRKDVDGTAFYATDTFLLTVNAVNDPPTLAAIPTQTVAEDSGEHIFQLTGITAGPGESQSLSLVGQSSDTTLIPHPLTIYDGDGTARLLFTPEANRFGTATITVYLTDDGGTGNGGVDMTIRTFDIVVTPVADPPDVTPASARVNQATTSGLVLTPNAVDGSEVQYFRITNLQNGTLMVTGTSTAVVNGSVLSLAQGAAGLTFTPALASTATGSFDAVAQLDTLGNGASTPVTATIPVVKHSTATSVSTTPNPSIQLRPVTVNFTVASTTGGPTPTGSVEVHIAGSSETCSATLDGSGPGSCQISPADAGVDRVVTATYAGDGASDGSVGTTNHTVVTCFPNPVVVNTGDSGPGSLRQAIADACGTDTITFAIPGDGPHTIALLNIPLNLSKNLTITGPVSESVTITAGTPMRLASVGLGAVVTIENLTLAGGHSPTSGGAITSSGDLRIRNSTLSGNQADVNGGAIEALDGFVTIYNSTLSGNTVPGSGSAIWALAGVTLVNTTVTANSGLDTIFWASSLAPTNSIIAGNTGENLSNSSSGGLVIASSNLIDGDPKLGPLQDNGGPTFTHALLANSPALDAGDNDAAAAAGITTDQRGVARAFDGPDADTTATVDIGAFEARASIAFTDTVTLLEGSAGATVTLNLGEAVTLVSATTSIGPLFLPQPPNFELSGSGPTRSLFVAPAAQIFGAQTVDIAVHAVDPGGVETLHATLTVNVLPVADTPSITDAATDEDVQSTFGLVAMRSIVDGSEVGYLKILSVVNGTLYKHDGVTPIAAGTFIPFADGEAGLRFTPSPNTNDTGLVTVRASLSASDAGLGGAPVTASIFVANPIPDPPQVSNVTTLEDTQSGLIVVQPNPVDVSGGAPILAFEITGITGGRLFRSDGPEISNGHVISTAQGAAGVRFTPSTDSIVPGHFTARAGFSFGSFGSAATTATITVTPVADTPSAMPATTYAQKQTTSGLRLARNAADSAEVTHFKISGITNGTLFQHDGVTPIADGAFITFAQGDAGLTFTPSNGFVGAATFQVQAATDGAGAGLSPAATATITVDKHLTAITITSHTPNPVDRNTALNVNYSVVSTTGGPTPTGTVTVTLGARTCNGTVAAGHCTLSPNTGGTGQTLTATYNGDALSQGSTTSVLQDVNACPTKFVTTTADSGPGSLRQAIAGACSLDLVRFDIPGAGPHTILLTSGALVVDKVIWFLGPLDERVRISGNHASRVFDVTGAGATFTGLEIVDGAADEGAGIRTVGGTTLDGVTLSGNVATVKGGGILASAAPYLEIFSSTISGNSAPAGSALWSADSEMSISGSTVTANTGGTAVANLSFGATTFFAQLQNSIITGNDPSDRSGAFSDNGGNLLTGDPLLGPLQDNGGPTFTHMPLAGSPAIDAGSNTLVTDVTDQRGFARVADGPDVDQTATVDIGAIEAIPSVGFIARTNMSEDGVRTRTFVLGTIAEPFTSIVATSSDQTLMPNASLVITGSGDERTLTITPTANRSGTVTVTVAATAQIQNGATGVTGPLTSSSSFQVVVLPLADTPSVTNASTPANQQTAGGLVITRNAADGVEVTHYQITAITGGALFQHDGVTPIASAAFVTVAQGAAGLRFTPASGSIATGHFSVRASIGGTTSGLGGATVTANIAVGQATTAVAVSTSGSPSPLGGNVTFTATVTPAAATGTVQFMDGASALGTPVPVTGGAATLTTAALALGAHAITAAYSGDAVYLSSTGTLAGGQQVGGARTLLTGADAGGSPHVRRFMALDGSVPTIGALNSFFPFDPSFTGGVRVAEGDVNGDGVPDYIVGTGAGGPTEVRIVDGATGVLRASLVPFGSGFLDGVYVAAGDVNGDGFVDVIAGSGAGFPGQIKVYSGRDLSVLIDETLHLTSGFAGGVHVAAGDFNADGFADLVIGASSSGSEVTVLSGANLSILFTFEAYPGFTGGVFVAAGDVTGDGYADIITGAGAGGGPHVKVFDGRPGGAISEFFAFAPSFTGGVRVAVGDVNGDGHAEILVAAGPGGAPEVRVFDPVTTTLLNTVLAYAPGFSGGVFVATAAPVSRMSIDAPVVGSTTRGTFTVTGWAFEEGGTGVGIAGIDVAALPVGGGAAIALGSAALGGPRPDVAAIYGAQYADAGFQLAVIGLAPGVYDLRLTARSAVSGAANLVRTVRITVAPDPQPLLAIDIPAAGRLSSGDFVVGGWALTPETLPAPGVDAVHVWAAPVGGGAWHFLGSTVLGLPRPDVAIAFGSQYAAAGYYLNVTGLAPGTWDLLVFPRRTGTAAFAAPRVVRVTVAGGSTRSILTGADAGGGPHVKRFDALDGGVPAVGALSSFFAFDGSVTGGVRVAEGDVTGDGVPDYIAGAGRGAIPEIRIIDGALGTIRASLVAFEPDFRGGVFVAAADVNGDGFVDVIAGSGEGRRGEIKVFSGRDLTLLRDVFVFDAAFRGGVHVAAGDVNGDGYADLVAGAGAGGTEVLVLNATDLSTLWTVTPYAGFLGGAWVAAGDVTGDGFADVITGAGPGGGPHVRVYDGRTGVEARNFFAYEPEFAGGVRVAVGDVNGDGRTEIITGPGPGRAAEVRVFDAASAALLSNVFAYPGFTAGVFVATAAPVNRMALDTPADGAIVHGPFAISGWAFDEHPSTAGLDAIHVWAFPVAGGSPSFGGAATLGIARPDVAALYGAQYANAGFHVDVAGLAPGVYDVVLFGHSSVSGTFNVQRVVRVVVTP